METCCNKVSETSELAVALRLFLWLSAITSIMAFFVGAIARDHDNILPLTLTVTTSFSFSLAIFSLTVGLVCCLPVGLNVIGPDVILTHDRANSSLFPSFSTCLLLPSFHDGF